jgi:hypothetical protein
MKSKKENEKMSTNHEEDMIPDEQLPLEVQLAQAFSEIARLREDIDKMTRARNHYLSIVVSASKKLAGIRARETLAEQDELRRDRERLDWMDSQEGGDYWHEYGILGEPGELRNNIDAAMQAGKQ